MKKVLLAAFTMCCFGMQAQIANMPGTLNKPLSESSQYKATNGTPYFIKEFRSGTIIDRSGRERKVFLKYDTYKEEIELFNDGQTLMIDKNVYPKFTIEFIEESLGKRIRYTFSNEIQIPGYKKSKYSLVLSKGKNVKLVKVYNTILNESQDQGYGGTVTPHWFQTQEIYYLLKASGEAIEIKKSNNKSVLKALGGAESAEVKAFLKQNKIKIRKEEDLIQVANFLDTRG